MRTRSVVTFETSEARRWALVRLGLGLAQMGGAVVTAVFLVRLGPHRWALAAAAGTTVLTLVSRLLFGHSRR